MATPSATTSTPQPAAHLRLAGISHAYAERRVLSNVSFVIPAGDRTGLIGENGTGKSTLLRIIAGQLKPDEGTVSITAPGRLTPRIGLLHQETRFLLERTVQDAVEGAIIPLRAAAAAVSKAAARMAASPDEAAASQQYARALAVAEHVGAWHIDARVTETLTGLGLGRIPRDTVTGALSGGQQARLGLALLLLSTPDVLLLDEPTNHLDADATSFLRQTLRAWTGPVLIASHDRAFLNEAVTSLVDLDPAPLPRSVAGPLVGDGDGSGIGVTRFSGNYTAYLHARMDARNRWEHQYQEEQSELKRLRSSVHDNQIVGHEDWKPKSESRVSKKFYSDRNAKVVSRRIRDARLRLRELELQQIQRPPRQLWFRGLPDGGAPASTAVTPTTPAITATGAEVENRLRPLTLSVPAGGKYLLTGPNGSGKTTFLQLLTGQLEVSSGQLTIDPTLRIGLLSQGIELPDPQGRGPERTASQVYQDLVGTKLATSVPLDTFGLITSRDEGRPLHQLSVGQQRRLALAIILADPPDILLLDEPTNHLSLVLLARLEAAIPRYPGVVIVASHDRWLLKTWTGQRHEMAAVAPCASVLTGQNGKQQGIAPDTPD